MPSSTITPCTCCSATAAAAKYISLPRPRPSTAARTARRSPAARWKNAVSLLQEVAEEWKQQNAYDKTPGKELLQRQIETLHAVRRHYLDELIHYLERVQAAQHS